MRDSFWARKWTPRSMVQAGRIIREVSWSYLTIIISLTDSSQSRQNGLQCQLGAIQRQMDQREGMEEVMEVAKEARAMARIPVKVALATGRKNFHYLTWPNFGDSGHEIDDRQTFFMPSSCPLLEGIFMDKGTQLIGQSTVFIFSHWEIKALSFIHTTQSSQLISSWMIVRSNRYQVSIMVVNNDSLSSHIQQKFRFQIPQCVCVLPTYPI